MVDRKPLTHQKLYHFHFTVSSSIIEWRLLKSIFLLDVYALFDQIFHHSNHFVAILGVISDTSRWIEEILSVLRLIGDISDFDGVLALFGLQIGDFTRPYGIYYGFADLRSDISSCGTNCLPRSWVDFIITIELLLWEGLLTSILGLSCHLRIDIEGVFARYTVGYSVFRLQICLRNVYLVLVGGLLSLWLLHASILRDDGFTLWWFLLVSNGILTHICIGLWVWNHVCTHFLFFYKFLVCSEIFYLFFLI